MKKQTIQHNFFLFLFSTADTDPLVTTDDALRGHNVQVNNSYFNRYNFSTTRVFEFLCESTNMSLFPYKAIRLEIVRDDICDFADG